MSKNRILEAAICCYATVLTLTGPAIAAQKDIETPDGEQKAQEVKTRSKNPEIVVMGKQIPYIRLSETATKMDEDLLETPLSVTILNETFLQDLRAETLSDAYPYTLGLSQTGTNANNFTLRGLPSDLQNIQIDGLPGLASRFGSPTTANIERVEVLKGPASVLYGQMEPGGLINIITRRPEAEQSLHVSTTAQSYSSGTSSFGNDLGGTLTIDATGPLDSEGRLLYRMIGSIEHIDSFRNGVTYKNYYLFPSLSYQVNDRILATVGMEIIFEEGDADQGLVAVNNEIDLTAPINVRYQEEGDFDDDQGIVAFARLEYDISNDTRFRVNYRSVFHTDERRLSENNRVNDTPNPLDSTLRRRDRHQLNKRQYHFLDTNLNHSFNTGALEHKILIGANGGFERSDFERIRFGSTITPDISVFNPILNIGMPSAITAGTDRITDRWNYGIYVQDIMKIGDKLSLLLGGRYDRQDVNFTEQNSGLTEKQTTKAFLPQGGIIFKPVENISVYASYTESFSPNSVERRDANGGSFDPEEGEQIEIGIKAALADERLNITVAGFEIKKTNILERDMNGDFALLGSLQSRGMEIELQALPVDHWQIRMGYAYVDSIVDKSPTTALIGARNAFAPEHDAFLWTRYNIPHPVFGGTVGASFGVSYESIRFTNASSTTSVELPSYARVDMGIYFDTEPFSIALNVENLLNNTYYTGGSRDTKIHPGEPRLVTLSLNYGF